MPTQWPRYRYSLSPLFLYLATKSSAALRCDSFENFDDVTQSVHPQDEV